MIFSKSKKIILLTFISISSLMVIIFYALAFGWLGKHDGPGVITEKATPQAVIEERMAKAARKSVQRMAKIGR